jgi:hypothetical protein
MATATKYVQNGSFDFPPEQWAAAKSEIRAVLVVKAMERAMIPYSDLVAQVRAVHFKAFDVRLFSILGQISSEEHAQGRPLLSVLVVHKTGDMQPGDGFFELAESLGRDTSNLLKAWIVEVQKVHQYWNGPGQARSGRHAV